MQSVPTVIVHLYLPIVLCLLSLFAISLTRKGVKGTLFRLRPLGRFIEFEIPVSNITIVRLLLSGLAIAFLSIYLFLDYSSLFPENFDMDVFYDEAGIGQSLKEFSQDQLSDLNIPKNYTAYQQQYYENLDAEVRKLLNIPRFISMKEGSIHSSGKTSFVVKKMGGWQKYYIAESKGYLAHILEIQNLSAREFHTFFEKQVTKEDYLKPTFADIFIHHNVVLRPQFKQIITESGASQGVEFKFSVVGATKVTMLPWPGVSNTVYFAKFENIGLVPIAYAVYR